MARRRVATSRRAERRARPPRALRPRHACLAVRPPPRAFRGATRTEDPLEVRAHPRGAPALTGRAPRDALRFVACFPSARCTYRGWAPYSGVKPGPLLRRDGRKPPLLFKQLLALLVHAAVLATAPCAPPRLSRRSPHIHYRPTPPTPPLGPSRAVRAAHSLAPAESSPEPELPCPPTDAAVAPRLPVPLTPFLRPKSHPCDHVDLPSGFPGQDRRRARRNSTGPPPAGASRTQLQSSHSS
jgi:hypothetical protein